MAKMVYRSLPDFIWLTTGSCNINSEHSYSDGQIGSQIGSQIEVETSDNSAVLVGSSMHVQYFQGKCESHKLDLGY